MQTQKLVTGEIFEYKLACAYSKNVSVYSLQLQEKTLNLKSTFSPHEKKINCIQWNHNSNLHKHENNLVDKVIATGSDDGTINLSLESGAAIGVTIPIDEKDKTERILALSLSAGSRYLAYGGTDQLVRIWDLRQKEMLKTFKGHVAPITCITMSPDAKYVVTGSENGDIVIHNFDTNALAKKLQHSTQAVRSLQFSTKKKSLLATGTDDGSIIVWDVNTGRHFCAFIVHHSAPCVQVAFSTKREMLLVSAGADKRLLCFDIDTKKQIREYDVGHVITCMSFLEDGCTIALGTSSGLVIIYDLKIEFNSILSVVVNDSSPISALSFQIKLAPKVPVVRPTSPTKSSPRREASPTKQESPRQALPEFKKMTNSDEVFSPVKSKPVSTFPSVDALRQQVKSSLSSPPLTTPPKEQPVIRAQPFTSAIMRSPMSDDGDVFSPLGKGARQVPSNVTPTLQNYINQASPIEKQHAMDEEEDFHETPHEDADLYTDRSLNQSLNRSGLNINFMDALDKKSPRDVSSQPSTPNASVRNFQTQFQKGMIEDIMTALQHSLHNDIRNMHLDMLQQFHNQNEMQKEQIKQLREQVQELSQQVETLREENKRKS